MPNELMQAAASRENDSGDRKLSIVSGTVKNNCDLIAQGKVLVRIPSLCREVWARLTAIGAGSGSGFQYVPRIDDEVLVALNQSDPTDAFVIGGVWNNQDRTPTTNPVELLAKRTIRSGITDGVSHEIELDDARQSINITSSTRQRISIDPVAIEIRNSAGTLTIKMDNGTQTISIQAAAILELKAPQIKLEGTQIELKGTSINAQASGPCSIQGLPVKIN